MYVLKIYFFFLDYRNSLKTIISFPITNAQLVVYRKNSVAVMLHASKMKSRWIRTRQCLWWRAVVQLVAAVVVHLHIIGPNRHRAINLINRTRRRRKRKGNVKKKILVRAIFFIVLNIWVKILVLRFFICRSHQGLWWQQFI